MIARPADFAAEHRFAWDGFSFNTPADWDLSFYDFARKFSSIRMEDASSIRLEMEWMRPDKRLTHGQITDRYLKQAEQMTRIARKTVELKDLPNGWFAYHYQMPDERSMITAFWPSLDHHFLGLLRLHFDEVKRTESVAVLTRLAASCELHAGAVIPWSFLGIDFRLDREFKLASTALQAGSKALTFYRGMRKLHFWQFSLADEILKQKPLAAWAAAFLNDSARLKGPHFSVEADGRLNVKRHRRFPMGHYDEIGRQCFRYRAGCAHLEERNALALWVYNYRSREDLAFIRDFEASFPSREVQIEEVARA